MDKKLYNLQRFLLLQTKIYPQTTNAIPDAYAYAWYEECYPMFDEGVHQEYENNFKISRKQIEIISAYADSEWLAKRYYTFYQYEDHFAVRNGNSNGIDRISLTRAFRYMFLNNLFDNQFWDTLLKPTEHPTEASGITRGFNLSDIYLV
ncbi:hypothetical protein [Sphingobacterium daejeonense]|uniref:hypothetical protein n=1 Tax=Sphingobacterium daejeonense TaxID=371142 RepID=UPI0010C37B3F|nr:hypothetical protein [Sphingobacterium daejeonense]VTP92323.1 Uncharacterised protein [Sphingobacterium daejeonense]